MARHGLSEQMTTRQLLAAIATSDVFLRGQSEAVEIEEPMVPSEAAAPLTTEAARRQAARELVLQELEVLRQRLPNDRNLPSFQDAFEALPEP